MCFGSDKKWVCGCKNLDGEELGNHFKGFFGWNIGWVAVTDVSDFGMSVIYEDFVPDEGFVVMAEFGRAIPDCARSIQLAMVSSWKATMNECSWTCSISDQIECKCLPQARRRQRQQRKEGTGTRLAKSETLEEAWETRNYAHLDRGEPSYTKMQRWLCAFLPPDFGSAKCLVGQRAVRQTLSGAILLFSWRFGRRRASASKMAG